MRTRTPKKTRSKAASADSTHNDVRFFFCHLELAAKYHQEATLELDQNVHMAAEVLEETSLLALLIAGGMILVSLNNHMRAVQKCANQKHSRYNSTVTYIGSC